MFWLDLFVTMYVDIQQSLLSAH